MRAASNVASVLMWVFISVVAVFALLSVMGGVTGQIGQTAQQEKDVLLCDNAVRTIVNNPGKEGKEMCLQKYCLASEDDEDKCIFNNLADPRYNDECSCELIDTGAEKMCMVTSGYNTPGLRNKIDVYSVCGYDLTDSDECPTGRLEGERSTLLLRIGRMVHLACNHGQSLNIVDDFPVFVEACKFKLRFEDYDDSDGCKLEEGEGGDSFGELIGQESSYVPWGIISSCIRKSSEERADKIDECKKYLKSNVYTTIYQYYLCMTGSDDVEDPPCTVGHSAESEEYSIVYYHREDRKPLVKIGDAGVYEDPGEVKFCG